MSRRKIAVRNADLPVPDEETDARSKQFSERLRALNGRAISAKDAWRCCVRSKRQAQKLLLDYADSIVEIVAGRMKEAFVAPIAPSVVKTVRVAVGLQPKMLAIGWVTTTGTIGMFATEPSTQAQAELVAEHFKVATETIRKTEEDCLKCVEQKLWNQSHPRKRRTFVGGGTILRREPGGAKP